MDPTKPYGEACTPSGGLKDADDNDWVNDPDDPTPVINRKSVELINGASFLTLIRQELPVSTAKYANNFGCLFMVLLHRVRDCKGWYRWWFHQEHQ
jgi:hypothetical protein